MGAKKMISGAQARIPHPLELYLILKLRKILVMLTSYWGSV